LNDVEEAVAGLLIAAALAGCDTGPPIRDVGTRNGLVVDHAVAAGGESVSEDRTRAATLRRRIGAWLADHQPHKALSDLDHLVALEGSAEAYGQRAAIRTLVGDWQGALEDSSQVIARDDAPANAFVERAQLLTNLKRDEEAIADLTQAIARDPDEARIYHRRGDVYRRLGKRQEAEADVATATGLERANAALGHRARTPEAGISGAGTQGPPQPDDDARYNEAIALAPGASFPLAARAKHLARTGRTTAALDDLTRAIALTREPRTLARHHEARSRIHEQMGRFELAVADMMEAMTRDRAVAPLLGKVGSEAEYEAAARLDPAGCGSYGIRAREHMRWGRFEAAVADIDRCPAQAGELRLMRGAANVERGDHSAAIDDFSKALKAIPLHYAASTYAKRGYANVGAGRYRAALADYAMSQMAVVVRLASALGVTCA
jgi:tetratricopeptide (TPR) repeat protein